MPTQQSQSSANTGGGKKNAIADEEASMLDSYIYAEPSVTERLSQGGETPMGRDGVAELEDKVKQLEEAIEPSK